MAFKSSKSSSMYELVYQYEGPDISSKISQKELVLLIIKCINDFKTSKNPKDWTLIKTARGLIPYIQDEKDRNEFQNIVDKHYSKSSTSSAEDVEDLTHETIKNVCDDTYNIKVIPLNGNCLRCSQNFHLPKMYDEDLYKVANDQFSADLATQKSIFYRCISSTEYRKLLVNAPKYYIPHAFNSSNLEYISSWIISGSSRPPRQYRSMSMTDNPMAFLKHNFCYNSMLLKIDLSKNITVHSEFFGNPTYINNLKEQTKFGSKPFIIKNGVRVCTEVTHILEPISMFVSSKIILYPLYTDYFFKLQNAHRCAIYDREFVDPERRDKPTAIGKDERKKEKIGAFGSSSMKTANAALKVKEVVFSTNGIPIGNISVYTYDPKSDTNKFVPLSDIFKSIEKTPPVVRGFNIGDYTQKQQPEAVERPAKHPSSLDEKSPKIMKK